MMNSVWYSDASTREVNSWVIVRASRARPHKVAAEQPAATDSCAQPNAVCDILSSRLSRVSHTFD